jgi:cystathionine beta-lyase
LFDGINVPSKSFGELIEEKFNTPYITASQLSKKQKEKKDIVILDGRPFDEYNKMSIPGSICCPNAEIPYRISELIKSSDTEIIINCAGRTRSIIGAQTLINFGIKNKVYALENGTQGWFLNNFKLDHGKTKFFDKTPKSEKINELREKIVNLLENKVEIINFNQAQKLINDKSITTYVFDVRTNSNQKNKLSKLRNVPGGQLVQATDKYIGVLKSHVIVFDDGDLVRAGMTALWLKKMSYHCYVVNESPKKIKNLNLKLEVNFKTIPLNLINLENFKNLKDTHIFDIRNSVDYCKKRIKKSFWTNRFIIKETPYHIKSIILVTNDLPKASLIVSDLQEKDPGYVIQVYNWNDKDVEHCLDYIDSKKVELDQTFIDFNFHTHLRHQSNKEHARNYLKWETDLIKNMDEEERMFFRILL